MRIRWELGLVRRMGRQWSFLFEKMEDHRRLSFARLTQLRGVLGERLELATRGLDGLLSVDCGGGATGRNDGPDDDLRVVVVDLTT